MVEATPPSPSLTMIGRKVGLKMGRTGEGAKQPKKTLSILTSMQQVGITSNAFLKAQLSAFDLKIVMGRQKSPTGR